MKMLKDESFLFLHESYSSSDYGFFFMNVLCHFAAHILYLVLILACIHVKKVVFHQITKWLHFLTKYVSLLL